MGVKFATEEEGQKTIEFLQMVPVFSGLEEKTLESLLDHADEETFPAGAVILREGSPLADLYIVLRGKVEVRKKNAVLARLGKGQFFGEMAFLNELPTGRSADIVAIEETRCLSIKGPVFYAFLRRNPDTAIEVIRMLASRLREADWTLGVLENIPVTPAKK